MMAWKIPSVYQKIRYFAAFSKFFYQSESKNNLHDLMMAWKILSFYQKIRYFAEFSKFFYQSVEKMKNPDFQKTGFPGPDPD